MLKKNQPSFLLSERTSGVSSVIFPMYVRCLQQNVSASPVLWQGLQPLCCSEKVEQGPMPKVQHSFFLPPGGCPCCRRRQNYIWHLCSFVALSLPLGRANRDKKASLGELHSSSEHHSGVVCHHLGLVAPPQLLVHRHNPLHALASCHA